MVLIFENSDLSGGIAERLSVGAVGGPAESQRRRDTKRWKIAARRTACFAVGSIDKVNEEKTQRPRSEARKGRREAPLGNLLNPRLRAGADAGGSVYNSHFRHILQDLRRGGVLPLTKPIQETV